MDADDDDIITEESVDSNLIYLLSFAICYMNKIAFILIGSIIHFCC